MKIARYPEMRASFTDHYELITVFPDIFKESISIFVHPHST